ncbi:hypothetical protein [Streptomyces sp. NPDC016845]|uniref:hypothetical protein n=1 Tax=Streptomyces sp. NPDC016845 TaxID=3364972 RepID=UPI00378F8288
MQGTGISRIRWTPRTAVRACVLSLVAAAALLVLGGPATSGGPAAVRVLGPVGTAYATEPSPRDSLAGSRAGVGRTPPGRLLPDPDGEDAAALPPPEAEPSVSTPPSAPPERPDAERPTATRGTGAEAPLVNVVPLGAGLLLTGLGIGFLALRLRR